MRIICATPREIGSGLKRIWKLETGSPSSMLIIEDFDWALEVLEIFYRLYGAAVEELVDWNGHIQPVVGDQESGRWAGTQSKCERPECNLDWMMFLHSDLLKLFMRKNQDSTKLFP